MTKDEAMKLALEALENSVDLVREDAYQAEKLYGNYPTRQGKVNGLKVLADDHEKAITALREALAEQPAQQEPVECQYGKGGYACCEGGPCKADEQNNAPQPAQQEPVAVWELFEDGWDSIADPEWMETLPVGTKLYTSPPAQRTWVGLTDEEITDIWAEASPYYHEDDFARAIEAKLKEKNT